MSLLNLSSSKMQKSRIINTNKRKSNTFLGPKISKQKKQKNGKSKNKRGKDSGLKKRTTKKKGTRKTKKLENKDKMPRKINLNIKGKK